MRRLVASAAIAAALLASDVVLLALALAPEAQPRREAAALLVSLWCPYAVAAFAGFLVLGLFLGWVQFPAQTVDSPASALAERYKDDLTVMVARAYVRDGDLTGAFDRLRPLGEDNIPAFVQEVTERTISTSGDVSDIQMLVALSAGLGRLTPIMEPYRQAQVSGS